MSQRDMQIALRVLKRIEEHTIREPITIPALAAEFGIAEREVKSCIVELVEAGHKVGSNKSKPMGVFIARDPSEIYETAMRLHREGLKYLARSKKLREGWGEQVSVWEGAFENMGEV